jgi:hypothetical protein
MSSTSEAPRLDFDAPISEATQIRRRPTPQRLPARNFEYHLLRPDASHSPLLREAYELWRNSWQATLQEIAGVESIDSDDFGRQHEIGVLAVGRCCVSVTGLRWLDLSQPMAREDSYFRRWPESALEQLGACRVGVSSNTVVDARWRGTHIDPSTHGLPTPIALLTVALTLRRFIESSAEKFVGTARNDRSMNRVGTGIGGTKIGQIKIHGIESDLICQTRADTARLGPVVEELWGRRWQ